jgi:hypothetical protein
MRRSSAVLKKSVPAEFTTLGAAKLRLDPSSDPSFVALDAHEKWDGYRGKPAPTIDIDDVIPVGALHYIDAPGASITRVNAIDFDTRAHDGRALLRLPSHKGMTRAVGHPALNSFFDIRWARFSAGNLADAIVWAMKNDEHEAKREAAMRSLAFGAPTNGDTTLTFVSDNSTTYGIRHNEAATKLANVFPESRALFLSLATVAYVHGTDLQSRVLALRALITSTDLVYCAYWTASAK